MITEERSIEAYVGLIRGEPMINSRRKDDEVVFGQHNAYPGIALTSDIEISLSTSNIADLFIFMKVLVEEGLYLVLVHIAHLLWGYENFVSVFVSSLLCQLIDIFEIRETEIVHAEALQFVDMDGSAGIMRQSLVALLGALERRSYQLHKYEIPTGKLSYMYAFIFFYSSNFLRFTDAGFGGSV